MNDDFKKGQLYLLLSSLVIILCYLVLSYVSFRATLRYYPYYTSLIEYHQTAPTYNYKTLLLFITSPFNPLEVYAGATKFYDYILDPIILFTAVTAILLLYNYVANSSLKGADPLNLKDSILLLLLSFPVSYLVSATVWLEGFMPSSGSSIVAEYLVAAFVYVLYIFIKHLWLKVKNEKISKRQNLLLIMLSIFAALLWIDSVVDLKYRNHFYGLIYSFMFIILFHFRGFLSNKLHAFLSVFATSNKNCVK